MVVSVSCNTAHAGSCDPAFPPSYKLTVPDHSSGVRLLLFPGMPAAVTNYDAPPFNTLTDQLTAMGVEITVPALPPPKPCLFSDGGHGYADAFKRRLLQLTQDADHARGRPRVVLAGGISYGGLHAMMAYALADTFAGWFASLPVVSLTDLTEFKELGAVPAFDPRLQPRLIGSHGMLAWATEDERVNFRQSEALYKQIRSEKVTAFVQSGGHTTTPQTIDDIVAWVKQF